MAGLGLDCLERHAGLAQPGEAGVTQLMAGELVDPGAPACAAHDLVDSRGRERSTALDSLEYDEHEIVIEPLGPLTAQVNVESIEEAIGDRDEALMSSLAGAHEQATLAGVDVPEVETHDLAAPQSAEQHRPNHGPVPVGSQSRDEAIDLACSEHARHCARSADQRHGVRSEQPGDRRQTSLDGATGRLWVSVAAQGARDG